MELRREARSSDSDSSPIFVSTVAVSALWARAEQADHQHGPLPASRRVAIDTVVLSARPLQDMLHRSLDHYSPLGKWTARGQQTADTPLAAGTMPPMAWFVPLGLKPPSHAAARVLYPAAAFDSLQPSRNLATRPTTPVCVSATSAKKPLCSTLTRETHLGCFPRPVCRARFAQLGNAPPV